MRLVTLGVGAQASPAYAPAGLLVAHGGCRVMLDGGRAAAPKGRLDAWLVSDERCELRGELRKISAARGLAIGARPFVGEGLTIAPRRVAHTNHPTYGYLIQAGGLTVVWAPEFFRFPTWATGADLMFSEAAAWNHAIHFAGNVGGHMSVMAVAAAARRAGVKRLIYAHIGRSTLRAVLAGREPPFGEFARDGQIFYARTTPRE